MFDAKKTRNLSVDRVPLREFAADHGRSSCSPSPPGQDPSRPDMNYGIRPPADDPVEASDSLLRPTGVFRFSLLSSRGEISCITVAHVFRETSAGNIDEAPSHQSRHSRETSQSQANSPLDTHSEARTVRDLLVFDSRLLCFLMGVQR